MMMTGKTRCFVLLSLLAFIGCSSAGKANQRRAAGAKDSVLEPRSGIGAQASSTAETKTGLSGRAEISGENSPDTFYPSNYRICFGEQQSPLIGAVQGGDTVKVEAVLKNQGSTGDLDDCGNTALMYAVYARNDSMVTMLAQRYGFNPNEGNQFGQTPVHCAVVISSLPLVKVLKRYGGDLNMPDKAGNTPLGIAVYKGDVPMVEQLLVSGADANIKLRDNNSILIQACYDNNYNLTRVILEKARSINVKASNDYDKTALDAALEQKNDMLVRLIRSKM